MKDKHRTRERRINYKSKWNLLTEFESIECDRDDVAQSKPGRAVVYIVESEIDDEATTMVVVRQYSAVERRRTERVRERKTDRQTDADDQRTGRKRVFLMHFAFCVCSGRRINTMPKWKTRVILFRSVSARSILQTYLPPSPPLRYTHTCTHTHIYIIYTLF